MRALLVETEKKKLSTLHDFALGFLSNDSHLASRTLDTCQVLCGTTVRRQSWHHYSRLEERDDKNQEPRSTPRVRVETNLSRCRAQKTINNKLRRIPTKGHEDSRLL